MNTASFRKHVSLACLLSLSAALAYAAAPDLVVLKVSSPSLDGGVVKVLVKNQGNAPAVASHMAITITPLTSPLKVFSPAVGALAAGQQVEVQAQTGFLLSQATYEAKADRSNTVQESNERNNTLKGKFDGKP